MGEIEISKKIKEHPFFEKAESILYASCNTGNVKARKDPLAARVANRVNKEIEAPSDFGVIADNRVDSYQGSGETAPGQDVVLDYGKPGTLNTFDVKGKLKSSSKPSPAHPEWNQPKKESKKTSFWEKVKNVFKGKKKQR